MWIGQIESAETRLRSRNGIWYYVWLICPPATLFWAIVLGNENLLLFDGYSIGF